MCLKIGKVEKLSPEKQRMPRHDNKIVNQSYINIVKHLTREQMLSNTDSIKKSFKIPKG